MSRAAEERNPEAPNSAPGRQPAPHARRTRRLGWAIVVGAAAAVLAVTGIAVAVQLGGAAPQITTLAAGPGNGEPIAMKCAEITPEMLAGSADVAFEATATSIADDGTVTLSVTDRYAGEITDVVEVPQGDDLQLDGMPLHYEQGQSYLVAASAGSILSCGQSGPATSELEQLYVSAFGR